MDHVLPIALSSGQLFQLSDRLDFWINKLISDALLSLWFLRGFRHSCNFSHYWIFDIAFFLNLVAVYPQFSEHGFLSKYLKKQLHFPAITLFCKTLGRTFKTSVLTRLIPCYMRFRVLKTK